MNTIFPVGVIRTSIDKGEYIDAKKAPRFSDFCAVFMERHGNNHISYLEGSSRMDRLKAYFGNRRLSTITNGQVEDYRIIRRVEPDKRDNKSKIALSTIDREITDLRAILQKAVKWGFLAKNPTAQVEDYDEDNKREHFLSSG